MSFADLVRSAFRNAFRSRLRTTLTALSLFVGAFTLTLTTALGAGVSDYVQRQVASLSSGDVLVVTPAASAPSDGPREYDPDGRQQGAGGNPLGGGQALLSEDDIDAITQIDGVTRVEPVQQISIDWIAADATPDDRYELSVNATSSIGQSDLLAGSQLDQTASEHQLVLPQDYVESLGFDSAQDAVGQSVTLGYGAADGTERTVEATVAGIARTSLLAGGAGANPSLTAEVADEQAVPGQSVSYPVAIAYLNDDDTAAPAAQVADVKAALAADDLAGQTVEDQLGVIQTVINGIIGILSAFAVVALLAAAFGIVNTLLMSVQERTREIGLMKALGLSNGRVFGLFSLEAVVIGFLGSVSGAFVAIVLGTVISQGLAAGPLAALPGLTILLFQPTTVVIVVVAIMLIAFLAGVLPARRAARQDPIESLRYE